jgi:hypothetical protein
MNEKKLLDVFLRIFVVSIIITLVSAFSFFCLASSEGTELSFLTSMMGKIGIVSGVFSLCWMIITFSLQDRVMGGCWIHCWHYVKDESRDTTKKHGKFGNITSSEPGFIEECCKCGKQRWRSEFSTM